jgi:branched-chain amino acid transport system ATP-binding protein
MMNSQIAEGSVAHEANTYCLELKNVSKHFGGIKAVSNVSVQIKPGERLAILGPNGAGKTTLFNMISGEFAPTTGKIILFGQDVTGMPSNKLVNLGLARTFQITTLFPNESVVENIILALMGTKRGSKFSLFSSLRNKTQLFERADELVSQLGLKECKNELIKNLPYGNQRLVEITLALASNPRIICLDEPNAGLSNAESRIIIDTINNKIDRSITILIIEHDMDLVFEVADRIMVLNNGVEVATDTKENIRANKHVQEVYLGEAEK